jgi:hypothetical protein
LVEETPELDEEGDVELELGAEAEEVVVEVEVDDESSESESPSSVLTAIVRVVDAVFLAAVVVFLTTVEVTRVFAVVERAVFTTFVLPVAMIPVKRARPVVAAAAVQRVRRVRRREAAVRARRPRLCGSFMETMEPGRSGRPLAGSCAFPVSRLRHAVGVLATLFRPRYAQP